MLDTFSETLELVQQTSLKHQSGKQEPAGTEELTWWENIVDTKKGTLGKIHIFRGIS